MIRRAVEIGRQDGVIELFKRTSYELYDRSYRRRINKRQQILDRVFSDTHIPKEAISSYLDEIIGNPEVQKVHSMDGISSLPPPVRCLALYSLVRQYRPTSVVETGTHYGYSTFYILLALEKNGHGKLHSIDVDRREIEFQGTGNLPDDFQIGYMVPDNLDYRWNLRQGFAEDLLEPTLESIDGVDIFFHDSDHSESHKMLEFNTVLKYLDDGIISSHDVGHGNKKEASHAFVNISESINSDIHATRPFEPGDDGDTVFGFMYVD